MQIWFPHSSRCGHMSSYSVFPCPHILICKMRVIIWQYFLIEVSEKMYVQPFAPCSPCWFFSVGPQPPFPLWLRLLKSHSLAHKGWMTKNYSALLPREFRISYRFCQWDPPTPYLEGRRKTARSRKCLPLVHPSGHTGIIQVEGKQQLDFHAHCQFCSLLGVVAATSARWKP